MTESTPAIRYIAYPTLAAFHRSEAPFRCVRGPFGCLSADHDILTRRGWKPVSQWDGSEILVWSPDGSTKFEVPVSYIREPCDWFYHLRSRGLDLMVSAEHKIPFIKKYNPKILRIATAQDIVRDHARLRSGWDGLIPVTFSAPENASGISHLSQMELRLMVAICADGSFSKRSSTNRCCVCLRKPRKRERLEWLLQSCGIEWDIYNNPNRPTEVVYRFDAPERNKSLAAYWGADAQQLAVIADEAPRWDGMEDSGYGTPLFCSTDQASADLVAYAFSTIGRRAAVCVVEPTQPNTQTMYFVRGTNAAHASLRYDENKRSIERVPSADGWKYCFTTSTGFFVTRRGGKIAVTGNSGKSSAMCMEGGFLRAIQQEPSPDGVRRTRGYVVRNDFPTLQTTTIPTWLNWFPEERFGKLKQGSPIEQILRYPHPDGKTKVEVQVWFVPLDEIGDIKKLKSLELSWVWFNEATEILPEFFDVISGRIGRYPKDVGTTHPFVMMDYNPPNLDNWIYHLAEEKRPDGYEFFSQPSAVLLDDRGNIESSSGRRFRINPLAENLEHVAGPGVEKGIRYYVTYLNGKDDDFIQVYGEGQYGYIKEGRPVHSAYNDKVHFDPNLEAYERIPLTFGWDFGNHTACVITQITPVGQVRVIDELYAPDKSLVEFIPEVLQPHLMRYYPGWKIAVGWGDPSGTQPTGLTKYTCFQELAKAGYKALPAPCPANDFGTRRQAMDRLLGRMVGSGKPMFILGPKARMVRAGMLGQYRFKRRDTHQGKVFQDYPEKNDHSHPVEATHYIAVGLQGPQSKAGGVRGNSRRTGHQPLDQTVGY